MMRRLLPTICLLSTVGCTQRALAPERGDGQAARYPEGSAEAALILRAANELTLVELDDEVPLSRTAAVNIVAQRSGADGIDGTADDTPLQTLAALDAVPRVGEAAMNALLAFAQDRWGGEVHGYQEGSAEATVILDVANTASHFALEHRVGLSGLAACNVFEGRVGPDGIEATGDDVPYLTLDALAGIAFVDAAAFDLLLAYGEAQQPPVDCPPGFIVSSDGITQFTTVTSALAGSPPGTVLDVCEGTFTGGYTVTKDVTLRGRGVGLTTLSSTGSMFTLAAATSLTIEGMSVVSTAFSPVPTGGIVNAPHRDSAVTVRDASISGGRATFGGAIYSLGALTVSDTTFADNTASIRTQGEVPMGGAVFADGWVSLERVTFDGNTALSESGFGSYGGAIYLSALAAGPLDWVDVSFFDNSAIQGGAMRTRGELTLLRGEFLRNGGTAISIDSNTWATTFQSTDFGVGADDNVGGDVIYGGAVMYYGNNVDLECVANLCQ